MFPRDTRWGHFEYEEKKYADIYDMVRAIFKDDKGNPLELTPSQCQMIAPILYKRPDRPTKIHLSCYTRFGKSLCVSIAVLLRVYTYGEKFAVIAPSDEQSEIIMSYIIQHAFDNPMFVEALRSTGEDMENLRRKRNREHLTFKNPKGQLGEVMVLSVNASNSKAAGNKIMGFGSPNVIADEAELIPDEIESKIFRMLGDSAHDFLYVKIGNPLKRGHFFLSYIDPTYQKFDFNYLIGLKEGRLTEDFVADSKKKPNFDQLYLNKFPPEDMVDEEGWSPLILEEELERAFVDDEMPHVGPKRLGVDISEGGLNFNAYTERSKVFAKLVRLDREKDLMRTAGNISHVCQKAELDAKEADIDAIGVGAGVVDRLHELKMRVNPVKVSEKAIENKLYSNLRAEAYWRLREWIRSGGRIKRHSAYLQLLAIKYRVMDSSGKIEIMPKKVMLSKGIPSPDVADSLMLTFARPERLAIQRAAKNDIPWLKEKKRSVGSGYNVRMA